MMETKLYRTVACSDRLPKETGRYIGVWLNDILTPAYFDNQIGFSEGVLYWLELVELPSEEAIRQFANELAQEGVYTTEEELEAYVDGASFILNHIKGEQP